MEPKLHRPTVRGSKSNRPNFLRLFALTVLLGCALQPLAHAQRRGRNRNYNRNNQAQLRRQQQAYQRQQQAYMRQQQEAARRYQAEQKARWQGNTLAELEQMVGGLDNTQKSKVSVIIADEAKQIEALGNRQNLTSNGRKAEMQRIRETAWSKIEPLLKVEQKQSFDESQTDGQVKSLDKSVKLDDTQREKVSELLRDGVRQTYRINGDSTLSPSEKNARLADIETAVWSKVDELMTPAQLRILEEKQLPEMLDSLVAQLQITDEQQVEVEKLLLAQVQQNEAIRSNDKLVAAERNLQIQKNGQAMWQQISALLDEKQAKKLAEMRSPRPVKPGQGTRSAKTTDSPPLAFPTEAPDDAQTNDAEAENNGDGANQEPMGDPTTGD